MPWSSYGRTLVGFLVLPLARPRLELSPDGICRRPGFFDPPRAAGITIYSWGSRVIEWLPRGGWPLWESGGAPGLQDAREDRRRGVAPRSPRPVAPRPPGRVAPRPRCGGGQRFCVDPRETGCS